MSSSVLTLRLPVSLKENLENLGKVLNRSNSYIACAALSEYLEKNAWQIAELEQAKKEIESGELISNNQVEEHLDSWE